jgi:pyruvate kinase
MNRHTRIVCTLGPATRLPKILRQLVEEGMDYARLNFSHDKAEEHIEAARRVREAHLNRREVGVIQDLQGPKLRIDKLNHPLHFRTGKSVLPEGNSEAISCCQSDILNWIHRDSVSFLDDGVELEVKIHEGQ